MEESALELRARWMTSPFRERRAALIAGYDGSATNDLRGIDLRGARIERGLGAGARLDFAQLDGAQVENLDLSGAVLSFASAVESRWTNVTLNEASFAYANFAGASLAEASLDRAILTGASFGGADLRAASLRAATRRGCDLEGAWLWGATGFETLADLAGSGGNYLQVMHMSRARVARAVEGAAWGCPRLDDELVSAMDRNWRHHVIAAAAAVLACDRLRRPQSVVSAIRGVLDTSRASPQLSVALSLLEPSFVDGGPPDRQALASRWSSRITELASPEARERWIRRPAPSPGAPPCL